MSKDTDTLRSHCQRIADTISDMDKFRQVMAESIDGPDELENISGMDYLTDALDIEYIVSNTSEYRGARVLVAFGGPNIWIDTKRGMVDGCWWGESASVPFVDVIGLDDALSELWACR
jgi:hypothetical protein